MQADDMHPTGRDNRSYVRLQFDRDAISLRSAPTALETWPWGGAPDAKLTGTLDTAASTSAMTSGCTSSSHRCASRTACAGRRS
jgi:hypothetical protein